MKTFEAVRLAMDLEKVIVIIAIDQKIALASLALHYEALSKHHNADPVAIARDYLGKVVHLPITLGAPSPDDVKGYLDEYLWKSSESLEGKKVGNTDLVEPKEGLMSTPAEDGIVTRRTNGLGAMDDKTSLEFLDSAGSEAGESIPTHKSQVKQLTGLSVEQRKIFKDWVVKLSISNPRQLKRLDNAYTLIRHRYPQEDAQKKYPMLKVLLWLEYLNELPIQSRQQLKGWLEGVVLAENVVLNKTFLPDVVEGMNTMAEEGLLTTVYQQVKGFVLPAIEKEELLGELKAASTESEAVR